MSEASPDTPPPRRPVAVTLAVIVVYLGAILSVVLGVIVLLARYETDDDAERLVVSLLGIGIALFGLLGVSVASGLARGSRLSQWLLTLFAVSQLVLQGIAVTVDRAVDVVTAVAIGLEVLLLVALWLPTSRRYMRRSVPAT
ncbi:hypothetical protein [Protaetiibacter intestinalis]|uniref:Uncharacterized protein n=1 Tax=Protaetiibacter intestinalis TaxID=2419774 RepID=A0A387B8Q8_9MICO|nr:hypothetical protein [Protaetiibacter intestinalis]AYF98211.1 hypothetical protein D7I47_08060 [Protaetiibacter intestinalis]